MYWFAENKNGFFLTISQKIIFKLDFCVMRKIKEPDIDSRYKSNFIHWTADVIEI